MNPPAQADALRMRTTVLLSLLTLLLGGATRADAQSLRGSPASLDLQNAQAAAHGFSYLRTPDQVTRFVRNGYLVPVTPTGDMDLHQVSFPYTRPEVRVFIHRLASQYRSACGEKLVVTSLTRPTSDQPINASTRSVHPTGMAVDLRRSSRASCREWLESTLLYLESEGIVEATRERNPPHYHLAVFPQPYAGYLAAITDADDVESLVEASDVRVQWVSHRVRRGETLTAIANSYGTSVSRIRAENGLHSDRLQVGQALDVPTMSEPEAEARTVAATDQRTPQDPEVVFAASESDTRAEPAASSRTHVVTRGESLWVIARRYGVDERSLRIANGLSGNRIYAGQELSIPGGSASGAEISSVLHTVARGESLWTIARNYGVDQGVIQAVNGLRGSRILIGQQLEIPLDGGGEGLLHYTVSRGESLWTIANRHGTTVDEIRRTNGMDTTRIYVGQVLEVPVTF